MYMQRKVKIITSLMCCIIIMSLGFNVSAEGNNNYNYNYNNQGEAVPSKDGYRAVCSISGNELGCGEFNGPSDIFCDTRGNFYIADTGNNRIVEINSEFTSAVREFDKFNDENGHEYELSSPQGIFISNNGCMYIADTGNSRILYVDKNGIVRLCITKPDSAVYENETFSPKKVIADKDGNVYSVLNNVTSGAAFFSSTGEFQGYYGANAVEPTSKAITNYFRKRFSTDKMRSGLARSTPAGITGFDIDSEGFVYTVTESGTSEYERVKKVNAAGDNLFSGLDIIFGDLPFNNNSEQSSYSDVEFKTRLTDVDVDDSGRICCLDTGTGRIFQYDEEGTLLFIMGGMSDRLGGFSLQSTAVEYSMGKIYVTDGMKNTVTIFEETDFGKIVHKATELYNDGRYEEALEPWHEALRHDGNYTNAYLGIASALISKGDYKRAMEYAELGASSYYYNKAFDGYREEWFDENFSVVIAAVIFIVLCLVYRHFRKKRKVKSKDKIENDYKKEKL